MFMKWIIYSSIVAVASWSLHASAEIKPYTAPLTRDNPEYKQTYLVDGAETTAQEALMAAIQGKRAMRCTTIEASINKSGNGISLKNTKKKIQQ